MNTANPSGHWSDDPLAKNLIAQAHRDWAVEESVREQLDEPDENACEAEDREPSTGEPIPCGNDAEDGDVYCAPHRRKADELERLARAAADECSSRCPDDCDGDHWHIPVSEVPDEAPARTTKQLIGQHSARNAVSAEVERLAAAVLAPADLYQQAAELARIMPTIPDDVTASALHSHLESKLGDVAIHGIYAQAALIREQQQGPVPTDPYRLAELIRDGGDVEVNRAYDRLREQEGHERASQLWQRAGRIVDHDNDIAGAQRDLRMSMISVLAELDTAQRSLDELKRLYHADYAEGTAGEDLAAHLATAARAVRAAQAINPERCDDTGVIYP